MLMFASPMPEVAGLQSEIMLCLLSPRQGAVEYNLREEGRAFLCIYPVILTSPFPGALAP